MHHTAILEKIKRLRKERGYSHEDMAERLHMSTSAYQRHESGDVKLELDWLQATTTVLNTDLLDLLTTGPVVVNMHDQQGGVASGYNNVVHHNGDLHELLKTMTQQNAEQITALQELNARHLAVETRLLELMERLASGNTAM